MKYMLDSAINLQSLVFGYQQHQILHRLTLKQSSTNVTKPLPNLNIRLYTVIQNHHLLTTSFYYSCAFGWYCHPKVYSPVSDGWF